MSDEVLDDIRSRLADLFAVACNYREGTSIARVGAKAYVGTWQAGNGYESFPLLVTSRGGRMVTKWERVWKLTNFRSVTIPAKHTLYRSEKIGLHPTRAAADAKANGFMIASRREATARIGR